MRTLFLTAVALGGSALLNPLAAQSGSTTSRDARVLPWVGCWTAVDGIAAQGRVCVIPAGERGLRIVSFADDGKSTESTLDLSGARTPIDASECTGWEQARLSKDADRILFDSELKCGDSPSQRRSTAFVITPTGYWLQVNGAGIAMIASAQIRLYAPAESYGGYPADIRAAVAPYVAQAEAARLSMIDRPVSATDLVELESMGVATPVIDLVVAASYPKSFVIDAQAGISNAQLAAGDEGRTSMSRSPFMMSNGFPMLSYYDMLMLENCMRFRSYNCGLFGSGIGYSTFGYSRYGYNDGFGPYYGGGYWPGTGGLPVTVRPTTPVPSDRPGNRGGGRAVSGQGYTAGTSSSTGTRSGTPRSGNSATTQSSGSSGASSSSGSSGSTGASAAPAPARTAQPRNP
jgi:hypothetical protein